MNLDQKIEAILFFRGESVALKKLASILQVGPDEVKQGIEMLKNRLQTSALTVIAIFSGMSAAKSIAIPKNPNSARTLIVAQMAIHPPFKNVPIDGIKCGIYI